MGQIRTNCGEDFAVHVQCYGDGSLADPSGPRVYKNSLSRLQPASNHQRVVCCGIHHWDWGCLFQRPKQRRNFINHQQSRSPSPTLTPLWRFATHQFAGTSQTNRLSASTLVAKPLAATSPITRLPLRSRPENSIPSKHCCRATSPGVTNRYQCKILVHSLIVSWLTLSITSFLRQHGYQIVKSFHSSNTCSHISTYLELHLVAVYRWQALYLWS